MSLHRMGPWPPMRSQRAQFGATSAWMSAPGGGRIGRSRAVRGGKVSGNGWLVEEDGLEKGRDVRWRARERTDGRADRARMRMDCIVVVKSQGVSYYVKM